MRTDKSKEVLTKACTGYFGGWHLIWSIQNFLLSLSPVAEEQLQKTANRFMNEMMFGSKWYIPDLKALVESGYPQKFTKESAKNTLERAARGIDAAQIVFAHSLLDESVSECCKASWKADQAVWEPLIFNRQVKLERIKNSSLNEVIEGELTARVMNLSLPKRVVELLKRCNPPVGYGCPGYEFDPKRLRNFDETRHAIIHRGRTREQIQNVEGELEFVYLTGLYLMGVTALRSGFELDFLACVKQSS